MKNISGIILTDLQKTFDNLDHKILLNKMKCIGFPGETIKWFHSYLTNRAFLGTAYSEVRTRKCKVLQESILGPFFFLLYVNDISQALWTTHTCLCADKTSMFCQHKCVTEIENVLNKEFVNVCDCFVDNKLLLHFGEYKTNCICFSID